MTSAAALKRQAVMEASLALAIELGQVERDGTTFYFEADTDKSEPRHRVDILAGRIYCSCRGFVEHDHCQHEERVRRYMNNTEERHLIVNDMPEMPDVWRSPEDLKRRLDDLKQERGLVQQFFKEVMVASTKNAEGVSNADGDYGIIPGTDKPTLFKAGAEKLCELYGYAPIVSDIQETADYESGHYRVVVRIALVHKGSGVKVAEGIGECNTRESRYWYRWVYDNEVPQGMDPKLMKVKEFKRRDGKGTYKKYRLENDDLFSVWNTILKMGKKRALVDATLSATRSSGLFTQTAEHLDEWIDAEYSDVTPPPPDADERPEREPAPPKSPVDLLNAISEKHGAAAASAARAILTVNFGTMDILKLTGDQRAIYAGYLRTRLNDPQHEHELAYTPDARPVCSHCGDPMEEPATTTAEQPALT